MIARSGPSGALVLYEVRHDLKFSADVNGSLEVSLPDRLISGKVIKFDKMKNEYKLHYLK